MDLLSNGRVRELCKGTACQSLQRRGEHEGLRVRNGGVRRSSVCTYREVKYTCNSILTEPDDSMTSVMRPSHSMRLALTCSGGQER